MLVIKYRQKKSAPRQQPKQTIRQRQTLKCVHFKVKAMRICSDLKSSHCDFNGLFRIPFQEEIFLRFYYPYSFSY